MLTGLCCVLFGLALADVPPPNLRPAMLDAPQEALQHGEALLAREDLDAAAREHVLRDMVTAALLLSPQHTAPIADRLEALGRDSGRPSALALADIVRARLKLEGGQTERGLSLASSATAALRALGQPYWTALADLETCNLLLTATRPNDAQPHCERAHASLVGLNSDEYLLARSENLLQWAYEALGQPAKALPFARAAHARYARLGSEGGMAMMDDNSATQYLRLGQPATALAASRRALAYELAHGKVIHSISSRGNIAEALVALKQPQQAMAVLDVALADARRLEFSRLSADMLAIQAKAAEQAGRLDIALSATRELLRLNTHLSSHEIARAVADLDERYDMQARETEIRSLRQAGELQAALLQASESDKASERTRSRLFALALATALCVVALVAVIIALRLRWQHQRNAMLSQVNRTRADMLAMAAHEVRNPMAAISGLIDMALQRVDDRRARGLLETARSTSVGLVRTAEDYLDHAQLALDRIALRDEPFDLPALLSHVAELFRAELAGRPIQLRLHTGPALPTRVCGDAARLQQILINLLGNAVKFTTAGDIVISAECTGPEPELVGFRITDSGPGIAESELRRLLQPFERGGGRTRRGVGLGLSIANQLVGIMGGELQIDTQLGVGSTFSFRIALRRAPEEPETEVEAEPETEPGNVDQAHGRVLIVDDDAAIRELLSAQLDSLGIEHRVAADIAEALTLWREFEPQTLLVDLHLNRENGIDLIRRIRAECAPEPPPRCLIHSASPPDGPHDRPPAEWQIEWVRKPMPLRDLGRLLGEENREHTPTATAA